LEKEMERLRGEMQDWRTNKATGKGSTTTVLINNHHHHLRLHDTSLHPHHLYFKATLAPLLAFLLYPCCKNSYNYYTDIIYCMDNYFADLLDTIILKILASI
jgi:hypothetical protein